MWALLYNCTEVCIEKNYTDPEGIRARDVIWRSAVSNKPECASKEWCEIMEGDVPNPSFEKYTKIIYDGTVHKPWIFSKQSIMKKSPMMEVSSEKYPFYWALDGTFFLDMGGNSFSTIANTFEVKLTKTLRISKGATHLSFFYALPYYSKYFSYKPFLDRTALDVYIDNEHLLHMYNKNLKETMDLESDAFYHPMNIDISRFANGKNHSLMIYFTEADKYAQTPGQEMLIDYIQVIKSNCKHQNIRQQVISLFFIFK